MLTIAGQASMKKLLPLVILITLFSCKKNSGEEVTTPSSNPFGVLVNDTTRGTNNSNFKLTVARQYGVPYLRDAINLASWNGVSDAAYDAELAAGFKVLLNVNNQLVATGSPVPFPTDTAVYKTRLTSLLNVYRPEVVVVENEETTLQYHSGPLSDYINELKAALTVAHAKGLKATNGGITGEIIFLVYKDYLARGLTAEAADYARRTMSPAIIADLPNLTNHAYAAGKVAMAEYLVPQYKLLNLDYVNLHWYEPITDNYVASAPYYGTKAFLETIDYLKRATGKTVITNEYGQDNTTPTITTDLQQAALDAKLPYAIWYDGDGTSAFGLHERGTTTLRPNGQAFAQFIQTHFK